MYKRASIYGGPSMFKALWYSKPTEKIFPTELLLQFNKLPFINPHFTHTHTHTHTQRT